MHVPSRTYKMRVPGEEEQVAYFTIVGENTPEAFFVNSKSMANFQWITALMTSYSRQIAHGVPIDSILDDMINTFDPKGKYIIPDGSGRQANSIVHHLGLILKSHMDDLKNREALLSLYEEGVDSGLNHLDASTYAEEKFNILKGV